MLRILWDSPDEQSGNDAYVLVFIEAMHPVVESTLLNNESNPVPLSFQ